MLPSEWARSTKAGFVRLQSDHGIPAIFAAAQHVHEGFNSDGAMSGLARDDFNFAGLKWVEWERTYGCTPVTYPTSEYIDGKWVKVEAQFCHCLSFNVWLKVYADLLTSDPYKDHLQYRMDPLLYGYMVGRTWATDPRYVVGIANAMALVWDDYADTLPQRKYPSANVRVDGGLVECEATIVNGKTFAWLKPVVQAIGAVTGWSDPTKTMTINTAHLKSLDPWEQDRSTR